MPLDSKIQHWLEQAAAGEVGAPADMARLRADTDAGLRQQHGPLARVARVEVFQLRARDGHPLRVIGYWPEACAARDAAQPALVFAHGGGWCLGSAEVYDNPAARWPRPPAAWCCPSTTGWRPSTAIRCCCTMCTTRCAGPLKTRKR